MKGNLKEVNEKFNWKEHGFADTFKAYFVYCIESKWSIWLDG